VSAPVAGPEDDTVVQRRKGRAAPPIAAAWLQGLNEGLSAASMWLLGGSLFLAGVVHVAIGVGAASIPMPKPQQRVEMAIYEPPPPPEPEPPPPEPEPEPEKPKPKPKPKPIDKTPPPPPPPNQEAPPDEPPPTEPVPVVTGISMASTVKGKGGPKFRVGNTTYGDPNKEKFVDPNKVRPYTGGKVPEKFEPVRQANVSTSVKVVSEYKPPYPRQLKEEGVEGTVILRVQVTKSGKTRKAKLVKGIHPVIDKLSLQAIERFKWRAATVNGEAVDTVITYRMAWELFD
jgi:TonB family protein